MVKAVIHAGVCGFTTRVIAESEDMQSVTLNIESTCPNITKFAENFPVLDAYEELGAGQSGTIFEKAGDKTNRCCTGCVVPAGVFKSMQVAAGLALPTPISIEIENFWEDQDV